MSQLRFFTTPLGTAATPNRQSVMSILEEFCHEVQNITQGKVTAALVPGFTLSYGQEYRATAHSTAKQIDHILFRAYVPADGLPMRFDFYDEDVTVCDSVDAVARALSAFAARDATRDTLRLLAQ